MDDSSMARMMDMNGTQTRLECGPSAIFHPLVPTKENAFNPCFISWAYTYLAIIFAVVCGIDLIRAVRLPKHGSYIPKSTGIHHWVRCNAVLLQGVLYLVLLQFTNIHYRYADTKILAMLTTMVTIGGVVLPLHMVETSRVAIPHASLLAFWPLLTILQTMLLYQEVYTGWPVFTDDSSPMVAVLMLVNSLSVIVMEACRTYWKPTHELIFFHRKNETHELELPHLYEKVTFSWMNDIIMNAYENQTITEVDLPNSPTKLSSAAATARLSKYWKAQNSSLVLSLVKAFGPIALVAFVYELSDRVLNFVQPQLLRLLIQFFNEKTEDPDQPLMKGILISILMFMVTILQTTLYNQYLIKILSVGLGCRSSLTSLIYQKGLRLSMESKLKSSTGDIVNLMTVDINRIQDVSQNLSTLILAPMELVLCVISLWSLLGKSTLSGVFTMLLLIPLNTIIVKYIRSMNKTQMKLKDNRSRIINEILSSIKSIKLYAWEVPMLSKLFHSRNDKELKNLKKIRLVSQCANLIWNIIPFLVSFATFATFAIGQSKPLTSDLVFPALALLNLLSSPLLALPMVINSIVEASVAIERIKAFLLSSELDEDLVINLPRRNHLGEETVRIEKASFLWEKPNEPKDDNSVSNLKYALKDIDFTAKKGELSCIVGKVGSGKTSFLSALLGQLDAIDSTDVTKSPLIGLSGTVAYCSQSPWIMNASVKENITFGCRYDEDFYQKAIEACQLLPDLEILPDGDETQVGEKGISLSGGQKARLALARAVYARADIYLFDDILSAVDSHVGKKIINEVLAKPSGLLATKTIILSTNSIPVLHYSNYIHLLENGKMIEHGTFDKAQNKDKNPKLFELIKEFGNVNETESNSESSSQFDSDKVGESKDSSTIVNDIESDKGTDDSILDLQRTISHESISAASIATFYWNPLSKILPNIRTAQINEVSAKGKVKWDVYFKYAKSCSFVGVICWMFLLVSASIASTSANYWLKYWAEQNSRSGRNANAWQFIGIYAIFGLSASLLTFIRGAVIWTYLAISSSKFIHDLMAKRVLKAPMSFFERTPIGRIMNRFTNDINKVDDTLPRVFNAFFSSSVRTIFTLGIVSYAMPLFLIIIVLLILIYGYYQRFYVAISRELKRLVSVSRSPIYAHLQESLNGVDTIRAYKQIDRFKFINNANIDFNLKSLYMLRSINRWLSTRLQFIGSIVIISASLLAIYSLTTSKPLSAGMAGFVMSYALQVTDSLNWVVRMSAEVESNIVSVERCLEYCELSIEENEERLFIKPPAKWPVDGSVSFKDYSTRYRDNLDLILKDINLDIKPNEKIGIAGRTGAGKSSLALAIFRIIEPTSGFISIDGKNTSDLALYDLRSNLSIIPQDSQAFEGTIRQNLDPLKKHNDKELWEALELAHLNKHVLQLDGNEGDKLSCKVSEGGSNFSSGQRQLMCLARALLNTSKVLILDEATAAVDVQTDKIIQETIRKYFKDKTIITIAHRLDTVMDSDKILALDQGRVKEFDSPSNLLQNPDSVFYSLCKQSGSI